MRKGIAVSPGIAVGTAYCLHEIFVNPDTKRLEDRDIEAELGAYEAAREKASADLQALQDKVAGQVGREAAAIFAVHEAILRDTEFNERVRDWIVTDRLSAPAALQRSMTHYASLLARTRDSYLKERLNDLRDVIERISAHLSDVLKPDSHVLSGRLIVVADELLPSQVVALGDLEVAGVVTQAGSQTSHAAILARGRGIPAVSAVRGILRQVQTGDVIVVDGRDGHVLVNPDPESLAAYRKLEREFFHLKDQLAENRFLPARTADGQSLELLANINNVADARAARAMGAAGVGLFRTEYIYLTHHTVPDEDEQLEAYRTIIRAAPTHSVTIRTLDIGGDKTVPYLGHHHQEANPFMGWRSIRLSFEHPEFFSTQLRAILRAAADAEELGGQVKLLFPMVTTVEELRRLRRLLQRVSQSLGKSRKRFRQVPVGMMLEVPAAAATIDTMLPLVDFVSIGSNDLVQYLMAADRDNPKVSHLYQPLAPAVLRVLRSVISICRDAGAAVTLCGEMAGQPKSFILLLGMGLRSFSMSSAFVPSIKELASHLSIPQAERILQRALQMPTVTQVRRYLAAQLAEISPNLKLLDTA
jgi:phosphotransferase system enzyme I (PtsI)